MIRRFAVLAVIALAVVAVLVLIGNVAVAHTNPPVERTIDWDSPETEALARAACFDCHSNETRWPWYSYVAPMAFLVTHDVNEGREEMNFSSMRGRLEGREMAEKIERGEMPLAVYLPLHPEANLSDAQKSQLIQGLVATFGR
ncbi:MAG: heme-binding domain-containing protein [Anaerolineae bacterium]|nr:heme-binding domain-containing protein [Anaerolineae bacterium]